MIFHLKIEELAVNMDIGVYNWERVIKQKVLISLDLSYTYKDGKFIDYAVVKNEVRALLISKKYDLLENAAADVLDFLKTEYSGVVTACSITMSKHSPSFGDYKSLGVSTKWAAFS